MKNNFQIHMGTGISSVMMIFVVLCLTTFSILSYTSAKADLNLTNRNSNSINAYYSVDSRAQRVIAVIDDAIAITEKNTDSRDLKSIFNLVKNKYDYVKLKNNTIAFSEIIDEDRILYVNIKVLDKNEENHFKILEYRILQKDENQEITDETIGGMWNGK